MNAATDTGNRIPENGNIEPTAAELALAKELFAAGYPAAFPGQTFDFDQLAEHQRAGWLAVVRHVLAERNALVRALEDASGAVTQSINYLLGAGPRPSPAVMATAANSIASIMKKVRAS